MILVYFFEHLFYSQYILLFWDTSYNFQILSNFKKHLLILNTS